MNEDVECVQSLATKFAQEDQLTLYIRGYYSGCKNSCMYVSKIPPVALEGKFSTYVC